VSGLPDVEHAAIRRQTAVDVAVRPDERTAFSRVGHPAENEQARRDLADRYDTGAAMRDESHDFLL
jgi:hypothetical protein